MNADQVGGWFRTALAAGFGYLAQRGYISADLTDAMVSGLGLILVGLWSHYTNKPGTVIK